MALKEKNIDIKLSDDPYISYKGSVFEQSATDLADIIDSAQNMMKGILSTENTGITSDGTIIIKNNTPKNNASSTATEFYMLLTDGSGSINTKKVEFSTTDITKDKADNMDNGDIYVYMTPVTFSES